MRTAKTLIRLGGCTGWSVSSLGAMAILLALSCGGLCIPCSWVPSIESESDCGSRSRWFDSGPATYRLLKLIMHIFFSDKKGSCQIFNLSAQIVWLQTYYDWNILLLRRKTSKQTCCKLGPPGFNCWFSFAPVFQWCCSAPRGSPGVGRNTFLSSPHLCFNIVFICGLFESRDDPLMS